MPVTSEITEDSPQGDGRRYVTEVHTDRLGGTYRYTYLADAATDASAVMDARAKQLYDDLLRTNEDAETANGLYTD